MESGPIVSRRKRREGEEKAGKKSKCGPRTAFGQPFVDCIWEPGDLPHPDPVPTCTLESHPSGSKSGGTRARTQVPNLRPRSQCHCLAEPGRPEGLGADKTSGDSPAKALILARMDVTTATEARKRAERTSSSVQGAGTTLKCVPLLNGVRRALHPHMLASQSVSESSSPGRKSTKMLCFRSSPMPLSRLHARFAEDVLPASLAAHSPSRASNVLRVVQLCRSQ